MPTAEERHERFNPGPPTRTRGWYGHFPTGVPRRRRALKKKVDAAWDAAIAEDARRERAKREVEIKGWNAVMGGGSATSNY